MNIWYFIAPSPDSGIGGFKVTEDWEKPYKINGLLLLMMYSLRQHTGTAIHINDAFARSGHSKESQHYIGNAVDFHFITESSYLVQIKWVLDFLTNFQLSSRIGLGIYPTWNHPGFHLDVRNEYARWGWLGKKDKLGKPIYDSFQDVFNHINNTDK